MKTFSYSAIDVDGVPQTGRIKSLNTQQASDILRKRNLIVTKLSEDQSNDVASWLKKMRGVPMQEKIILTRQLGTMIGAGLPVNQALGILANQTNNQYFADIIKDIAQQIDGGASLHDAFGGYEKIFGRLYLSLIKAGEVSGNLEVILNRLADSMEADSQFKSKVKGAMIYPVIIIIVMMLVLVIMFVFVIPRLAQLYEELDADLPFMTQLLIDASQAMVRYSWLIVLIFLGSVWGYRKMMKNRAAAEQVSRLQMKTPIFGPLTVEVQLTSFTRTLAMLLGSGIHLLEAIDISKETFGNMVFRQAAEQVSRTVEKGKQLSEAIRNTQVFPLMIPEMLAIGEQTGKVEEILAKLSSYYENQATTKTENLASAIEPIVMVLLGVIVGFLVVALILPIYSLTSQF